MPAALAPVQGLERLAPARGQAVQLSPTFPGATALDLREHSGEIGAAAKNGELEPAARAFEIRARERGMRTFLERLRAALNRLG